MRRFFAILCCLVLATTLVARGGPVACPGGMECCVTTADAASPTTTPATTSPAACCDEAPKPKAGEHHAEAVSLGMPCCAAAAWDVPTSAGPTGQDAVAADHLDSAEVAVPTPAAEPATPPPRAMIA